MMKATRKFKRILWLTIAAIGWVILSYFLASYFFGRDYVVYSEDFSNYTRYTNLNEELFFILLLIGAAGMLFYLGYFLGRKNSKP